MAVSGGEEDEFVVCISGGLAVRIQCIAGDYNRGCVRGATTLGRDSTSIRSIEAE